jgi:ribosome-associated translation inhibitor RaiA
VVTGEYEVQLVTRGDVTPRDRRDASARVARLGHLTRMPILFARVKLTQAEDPARVRPALAQATVELNGMMVRAHAVEETMHLAVDRLEARLRDKLEHVTERRLAARKRGPAGRQPHQWRHGDASTRRSAWYDRPIEERKVLRHKSYALHPLTPEEAVEEMDLLDYDFHLFTDANTAQDSVVYRLPDGQVGAMALAGLLGASAAELVEEQGPAVALTVEEAANRLALTGDRFVFFRDVVSGRGTVLYLRYDGHYGVVGPGVESPTRPVDAFSDTGSEG